MKRCRDAMPPAEGCGEECARGCFQGEGNRGAVQGDGDPAPPLLGIYQATGVSVRIPYRTPAKMPGAKHAIKVSAKAGEMATTRLVTT
ncbi:hypothetical protein NicSoilB8_18190 [Arthrobacter sp. NicSoilB8]|nr:hypothetical protein NicSoilB8_18190 [Arthrobacter sp. NicSoilB8]